MAGEISTLILTVDLDCHLCFKKIKNVLCKLQDKERIQNVAYDWKNKTVTISGPFDPICLRNRICCKACRVIKNIKIEEGENKPDGGGKAGPDRPKSPEPEKKKSAEVVYSPFWPVGQLGLVGPAAPPCCCRPCHVWCNGSCRCCSCGWLVAGPPPPPAVGKPVAYRFSCDCEEVPSMCGVM